MYGILSAEDKLQHQEPDVHVAVFYTTNRYSKIITNGSLWIFFFFFGRKNINTQNIEFVKILTRDKYLIHVSFLTNPIFLCTGPKRVPKSVLHIVYNSCIYIYIYIYVYMCMCVCICAHIYTFDLTCRAYMILKAK